MRKICVVTGGRADYGILSWLLKEIESDPALKLQLIATGAHLERRFGFTYKLIQKEFKIAHKVQLNLNGDGPDDISEAMGKGMIGFSKAFSKLKPDLLVLLGDRFEIFAAASASVPFRIPIAHIHGGETSQGAIDEVFRHSITKMAHYHFVAAEPYRRRVIQLGEDPERVFCVGAPGLDPIEKLKLVSRETLLKDIGLSAKQNYFIVTFHPVTLEKNSAKSQAKELLSALDEFKDYQLILTYPNADTEGNEILTLLKSYAKKNRKRSILVNTLGQLRYLSALKYAAAIIGNSSSALIEAPGFKTPAVNIGDRQKGRLLAQNVISCAPKKSRIVQAIRQATSQSFRNSLNGMINPYGTGNASQKIKNIIKKVSLNESVLKKNFYDLELVREFEREIFPV